MILLIGATGYIGRAFAKELNDRNLSWEPVSHMSATHAASFREGVDLVINCAAFIPAKSVSLCDQNQYQTINGNLILPLALTLVCQHREIPLAHISTGCLWSDGLEHAEEDKPQRGFVGHCGFYIGTKVMAEEAVSSYKKHYIWRVRLPFDEFDCERNYLSKLATMPEIWDHTNTISHRGDFAKACLDLWEMRAPWGTYHVMNPGAVNANDIAVMLMDSGIRTTPRIVTPGPQGGALVSVKKLLATGVKIRPAMEAIQHSITNWKPHHV